MLNFQRLLCLRRAKFWRDGFNISCVTILFFLISGCSAGNYGDPTRTDATAPVSLPAGPVALIVNDSATETVQDLITYNRYYTSGSSVDLYTNSSREAYVDTSTPKLSVAAITQLLEARLGKVHQFHSVEEASRNGFKLIVKLDMHSQLVSTRFSEPFSYLLLEFFAADHQYLGTLESSSRSTVTPKWAGYNREKKRTSNVRQQGESQAQTLELLKQKLDLVPMKR